jgi:hypothetical protein
METLATGLAHRVAATSVMSAIIHGSYALGGVALFALRPIYRPEGRLWLSLLATGMIVFGISSALKYRRGASGVVIDALLGLVVIGTCGTYTTNKQRKDSVRTPDREAVGCCVPLPTRRSGRVR